jgi:hypothetical protein
LLNTIHLLLKVAGLATLICKSRIFARHVPFLVPDSGLVYAAKF